MERTANNISIGMPVRHSYFLIWFFLFTALPAFSQNYLQDVEKIMNKYSRGDISFHMKYRFYPYDSLLKAADSMNASCCLGGGGYYYKIVSGQNMYEYVKNNSFYFVVDHSQKAIAVKRTSEAKGQLWDMSKMDSMMHSHYAKVTYKNAGKDEGEYDVNLTDGTWKRFKLVFNKSTYAIVKVYMYSSSKGKMLGQSYKNPMVCIYYTDYQENITDKSIFSETKFFTVVNTDVTPTQEYNKYKVLNYLKKQS